MHPIFVLFRVKEEFVLIERAYHTTKKKPHFKQSSVLFQAKCRQFKEKAELFQAKCRLISNVLMYIISFVKTGWNNNALSSNHNL